MDEMAILVPEVEERQRHSKGRDISELRRI
jgi:hypothetical protein